MLLDGIFLGLADVSNVGVTALYDRTSFSPDSGQLKVLLRAEGEVERLGATATVLGLFKDWDCAVTECAWASGDVLVIYTDGISEAGESEDGHSQEFGEER